MLMMVMMVMPCVLWLATAAAFFMGWSGDDVGLGC
jgi:hypothetical protein